MLKPKQEFFAKSASQIINEQRGTARMAMTRRVHPLLSLNPYQGSWIIKVRVTNKGVLRTYKIARGEGCVFNVELTDEGTEIQEPMFNAAARKSYDTFHKGKLGAKKCLSLKQNSTLYPLTNVIGVVQSVSPTMSIRRKSDNEMIPKRDITLVDEIKFELKAFTGLMLKPKQEFFAKSVSQIINEQRGIRVTNKGVLRTYKNARGEVCVFNVELTDEEGTEIQETMFNAAARKSYDTFQKGKVYYISRGSLKLANKQFKTVHNDYEMTLNEYEAGSEEMFITETKFNFVPIDELLVFHYPLSKAAKLKSWYDSEDVIGVVQSVSPTMSIRRKSDNEMIPKRDITLVDESLKVEDFKVQSSIFVLSEHRLHFVKSVADRNQFLQVFHYPLSKAAKLKSWYDSEGIETYMSAIVSGMSPSANNGSSTRAYISFIKPDQEGEANEFQTKLKEATWSSHLFRVSVSQQEYNIEKRQRITVRRVSPIDFAAKTRLLLQDVSKNKKTSQ
ncbi:hypothetical protein F2Q68_00031672 [Brassica cretica]|uniref:Uncharacterized protein n=1 Tax=Brassica cretica TaxID=69181 RepID=A0A8S9GE46_BRACR|nr:hypothetical protein F2Q68_00031672 [Brassica cretica]